MTRPLLSLVLLCGVAAIAAADPFSNVSSYGQASYSVYAATTHYNGGSSNTIGMSGDTTYEAVGGDTVSLSENWDYETYGITGYDEYGDPIYGTIYEPQSEYAEATAYAYARLDRSENLIAGEVYAYSYFNNYNSGSYSTSSANASAYSTMDLSFTLQSNTKVRISAFTQYGSANLSLLLDGSFFIDSQNVPGSYVTILPAGDYTITGAANGDGGASLSIEAVPEPATTAALGLAAAALLRRRRSR